MLTVIKNNKPTGTQYYTYEKKFFEHHESMGEILIDFDKPIVFDEEENLLTPFDYTDDEITSMAIRAKRQVYCFQVIDKSQLWFNSLSDEQKQELAVWYQAWLDAPDTLVVPNDLEWL